MNKFSFLIIILSFLELSVNAQFYPRFKNITNIEMEIDADANINKETPFKFTVFATTKKNKRKEINSMTNLKIWGENFIVLGKNKIKILKSDDCDLKEITINYSITKKEQVLARSKVVKLNYKGDLKCSFNGDNGTRGSNGSNGAFKGAVYRDGSDGENGSAGNNGKKGHEIKVFFVKDTLVNLIKIEVLDVSTETRYCYYTTTTSKITIESNGGNGGNGGNGANGKDGKHAKVTSKGKTKRAGRGGNGGFGASGGNGGNGGKITIYIHESIKEFKDNISTLVNGGSGGLVGKAGKGGRAGTPLEGGVKPKAGSKGSIGNNGNNGEQGFPAEYQIVKDYNFSLK